MSFRELVSYLDQYVTELITSVDQYRKHGTEGSIMELKRALVHLEAIVDELHEDSRAKTR